MNLNAILFPAPNCSYDYNQLKGQLIFIPKWKKLPLTSKKTSKIKNTSDSYPKALHHHQKPISKILSSLNDVTGLDSDRASIPKSQIITPILLSQKVNCLANNRKTLPKSQKEIDPVKLSNAVRTPRTYISNSFSINKQLSNKRLSKETGVNGINGISSNINITNRTINIMSKNCNKDKIHNLDESDIVEDQEDEPKNIPFNEDFKFIKNSNAKSFKNSKNQMFKKASMSSHKYPFKYVSEPKFPLDKNISSTNFDTCIFDENPAPYTKNNSKTTNELSRACSPNNVSKYNTNNSKLLNQHLRNPFTSFFLPINLKAEDHDNFCLLNHTNGANTDINSNNGITTNSHSLSYFSEISRSVVLGGNMMTFGASNNQKSVNKTQLTAISNVIDYYIPCLYLESTTPSNKILIYFHGNGEDINLANDLMIHIKNTMNVIF